MHTSEKILLIIAVLATSAFAAEGKKASRPKGKPALSSPSDVKLDTEDRKTLYALGVSMGESLGQQVNPSPEELEVLKAGLTDGMLGRTPHVNMDEYRSKIQPFAQARAARVAEAEKRATEEFLKKMAQEKGAVKTESGLIFIEEKAGTGDSPGSDADKVTVQYTGRLRDGTVFDSSVDRGAPATFMLGHVIPCWKEGMQKMKVGGKAKLVCPSSIAYGDRGHPPKIKPGAALVFEVELLELEKASPAALPGGHP